MIGDKTRAHQKTCEESVMSEPIYFVGGSKGGVGKSMVSCALLDYLQLNGKTPVLIEADTSNPDVFKAYEKDVLNDTIDLDNANGWIDLLNFIDEHKDKTVVINTPSRNNSGVELYGQTLTAALAELDRTLEVFWVINRQRDSLELLRDFMEAMDGAKVNVVRNLHHGRPEQFELYNSAKIKIEVEKTWKGKSLNFPDLADRVADTLNAKRLTIAEGVTSLPIGNRSELQRWRREVGKVFGEVISA